jgi:hypothetical protein
LATWSSKSPGWSVGARFAVQVAVARALALRVGEGIGHRDEGDLAREDRDLAGVHLGEHARDGLRPASLVAMDGAGDDEFRAGRDAAEVDGLEAQLLAVDFPESWRDSNVDKARGIAAGRGAYPHSGNLSSFAPEIARGARKISACR